MNVELYIRRALSTLCNSVSNITSSINLDVTFGILEAATSVNSAYEETVGLNILAEENWKYY